ncbi:MAG: NADH-quinone oxidoreductase subunit NuoH [Pirellulaceae bacterium]
MAEFINSILFPDQPDHWIGVLITALVHVVMIINVIAVGALVFIWMERKVSGRIQDRLGPTRVGGKFGWLQTLADGLKLIAKEDITPGQADSFLFKLAPYLSFTASFCAFIALPFASGYSWSSGWAAREVNTGVFFVLAVLGLEVFGVILAGYASGSKWSLFGGMREAAQVVSYEVPLGLCVIVPVMLAGSMNLVTIGDMQEGLFTNWFLFHDPFTFCVFWVFFTCAMASVNRAPFDLAEAESELVAGFHTEYSGLRWSIFFMAEYGSMFLVSALAAILFFGGWNGPFPVFATLASALGWEAWPTTGLLGYVAGLAGVANVLFKGVVGVTVMIWVRWTLPRLRIDQVITMCWKYCVPIAAVCFAGALFWQYNNIWFLNSLHPARSRAEVRENWSVNELQTSASSAPHEAGESDMAKGIENEAGGQI